MTLKVPCPLSLLPCFGIFCTASIITRIAKWDQIETPRFLKIRFFESYSDFSFLNKFISVLIIDAVLVQVKKLHFNLEISFFESTVCPSDIGPTSQPVLVYVLRFLNMKDKKTIWIHKRVRVRVPEYGSRFPSTGPLLVFYLGPGSRVRIQVPEYGFWGKNYQIFKNVIKWF